MPSWDMASEWHPTDVDATLFYRTDGSMMLFRRNVPAEMYFKKF